MKVKHERQNCGEQALYFAGQFLWHIGRHDKAREYVDRMLKMSPGNPEGLALRGWIDLTCGRDSYIKKSGKLFEEALAGSESPKLIEALFGKVQYLFKCVCIFVCLFACLPVCLSVCLLLFGQSVCVNTLSYLFVLISKRPNTSLCGTITVEL
jgi:tetratricopeptide (TPR) repeat protein